MNKLLIIFAILCSSVFGQVSVDLTIENQEAVGTDFFFDIYLTRTGTNDLYLGNADFVLTFAVGNFNTPTLSKVGPSPGNCTFVPTDQSGLNTLFTRDAYFTNTSVTILNGNELTINLNGPTPGDQATFDTRVALIDNSASTHRLGTFKVSGIETPSGYMNLQWKTSSCLVFTLANTPGFESSEATINTINPANAPLPVELTSFTANANGDKVDLSWETKTEVNNYGFDIERSIKWGENEEPLWATIGFIEGNGNSNSPKQYNFTDKNPYGGSTYVYRLKQIDTDGKYEYSDEVEVELVPAKYELHQNYPNPFNPITNIKFSLPEAAKVSIMIYNLLGELVTEVANQDYDAGYHKVEFNANSYASGVYIYRLVSKNFIDTKKMVLMK